MCEAWRVTDVQFVTVQQRVRVGGTKKMNVERYFGGCCASYKGCFDFALNGTGTRWKRLCLGLT